MSAVRCHDFAAFSKGEGGKLKIRKKFEPLRSVLSLDSVPRPSLKEGHVLIQTHYAGEFKFKFDFFLIFFILAFVGREIVFIIIF